MASSHAKLPRLFRNALPPIAQNQLILGFLKDSSKGGSGRSHFAFLGTYLREKRALCVGGGIGQDVRGRSTQATAATTAPSM